MVKYWWVNHKQTVRQEIEGRYLWSPKTKKNNARNRFYDNMRYANPGDLVLSYANGAVRFVGRVAEFAFSEPKPAEFGSTGSYWQKEGWYLPVSWVPLDPPVKPKDLLEVLRPLLPKKHSPIRPSTGDGNQGAYLAEIPESVFDAVVAASAFNSVVLERAGANSLTFQAIKDQLDDIVEGTILADSSLDSTTKRTLIDARRGQGRFRTNVQAIERVCRLTGISNPSLLIASHIKPWRSCTTADERLDGMNGLLLTPDADLLFDRGFITFEDDGEVRVSPRFAPDDLRRLGLGEPTWQRFGFSEAPVIWPATGFASRQCEYLAYHRSNVYVDDPAKRRLAVPMTPSQ